MRERNTGDVKAMGNNKPVEDETGWARTARYTEPHKAFLPLSTAALVSAATASAKSRQSGAVKCSVQ